jgi:hypothetical protein
MDDLLTRLRTQVERATDPIDPSEVRTNRPRRSSGAVAAVVAAALVAVVGAVALRSATREAAPSTVARGSGPDRGGVSVERIEVHTEPDGTQEIALVFDGQLPDEQVAFVDDITSAYTGGLGYTVQGPLEFHVCESVHSDRLAATGSVDVLIPSDWFGPGTTIEQLAPRYDPPIRDSREPVHHPGKIVACGPYHGYVQYSIWEPASDNANHVRLSVEDHSTRIVVEIRPEQA